MREKKICLIINPFAGAGGPLGWKGTDWPLPLKLVDRDPWSLPAQARSLRFLHGLKKHNANIEICACPGLMGEEQAAKAGFTPKTINEIERKWPTTPADTVECLDKCLRSCKPELIVFVGGDGTARLIASVLETFKDAPPALGIPAGVKVYSSVFAESPETGSRLVSLFLEDRTRVIPRIVLDIDEEAFRRGKLIVKPYGSMRVPVLEDLVVPGKDASHSTSELEEIDEIAEYFHDVIYKKCTLYIMGPGYTVYRIAEKLEVKDKTLLGVDAVHNNTIIGKDLDEEQILKILDTHKYKKAVIVVSPIGGQGFILGRGNQQISPRVIKRIGIENIIIVASPTKLKKTRILRVDTGDPEIDEMFRGFRKVITGYNRIKLVEVR